MNIIKNYRYYVLFALFLCGMTSALVASGNPTNGITARTWIRIVICGITISAASFSCLVFAFLKWKDDIPELTNIMKEE